MILIIQIIISMAAVGVLFIALVGKQSHAARAWKKLVLMGLAFIMLIAVFFPATTTWLAKLVGVGRGVDLLVYILSMAFIGYVLNDYLRQQKDRDVVIRLARKVALLEANSRYGLREK